MIQVLTVVYRKEPSVKASSPTLKHLSFAGIYIIIFGLMLFVFVNIREHSDEVSGAVCQTTWAWIFPIRFTLTIGTVTVRTWRLYRIFAHYLDPGKLISDFALIMMLLVFLTIDIIIATLWTALGPLILTIVRHNILVSSSNELLQFRSLHSQFGWEGIGWWIIVMSIRVGQLVVMVVFSLLTHHIPNKNFATSSLWVFSRRIVTNLN